MPPTTRNLTIFLTDIKGISAKTSRRARTGILELLASHHQSIVRPILQDKGGRMVKTIGDAFLMVFDSPTDAVLAGVAVQEALALHNQGLPEARRLQIRIAVNLGEVLLADNDVSGEPVDIVARLWAAAKPGEVYFTDAVYLAMNKSEVSIGEVDSFTFKGIPHTIRVYQARRRRSADGTQEQPQSLPRSTSDPAPVEDFVHLPPAEAPSPVPVYQPPEEALPSPQPASRPGPAEDLVAAAPAEPAPVEHAVAEEPPSSPPASRPSPTEDLVAAPPAEPVSVEHTVAEEPPQQYQAPEAQPGSPDDTLLGRQVGPCRVEALLGRGGMGAVYRAHHIPLDRPVALKVVSPEWLGSPAAAAAFVAEARIAARLEDPRIVQVYDVGVYGEQTYIVMQFLPGENLEAKVGRDGPLPPAEALRVIKEAALALAAAHRQGVVHRDVKPANIMLGPDGSVRLMDFGISVMTGRSEAQPEGISTMGSFDFMAPEQAFGGPPDPRMDLYSLGATYFYTLTARPPYEAKNAGDLLLRHREAPLPDVRELRPEVTAAVAGLIKRLMAKNPAARPAGAGHVLRELESPRMLLDVEASGSPFKLLPPPPEKEEEGFDSGAGFAPMAPAAPEEPEPAPEPAPAASPAPAAPHVVASSPLPPLPTAPAHRRQVVKVAAGVVGLAVMARLWHGTDRPDWAAAGVFAAAAAAFCLAQAGWRPWLRGLASGLAGVGMAAAFYRFGAGAFAWPAQTPDLDFFGLAAPGLVAAAAAFYLGVWTVDRRAAAGLMVGAGALLLLAAFSLQLPPEADWLQGVRGAAAQQGRRFVASGGLWRWGGLLALFLAGLFLWRRRSRSARSGQGPAILNWNR